jgi:hypothetical protein
MPTHPQGRGVKTPIDKTDLLLAERPRAQSPRCIHEAALGASDGRMVGGENIPG